MSIGSRRCPPSGCTCSIRAVMHPMAAAPRWPNRLRTACSTASTRPMRAVTAPVKHQLHRRALDDDPVGVLDI